MGVPKFLKDYYGLLGMAKNATPNEIHESFLRKAKDCHSDTHPNDSYQYATKRLHIGMKAAGTDARKFLEMLGFPAFSKTLAYSVQRQLNAIWY